MIKLKGHELKQGDEISDFRGDIWIYHSRTAPNKIYVKRAGSEREFYIKVFPELEVVDE